MTDSDELAYERVINRRYLRHLEAKPHYRVAGSTRRNRVWGALTGRLSLIQTHSDHDPDFYIGPQHANWDGIQVISWAAPAAAAFFSTQRSWQGEFIRVRRRFNIKQESIVGYTDEWVTRTGAQPFPTPPRRSALPRPGGGVTPAPGRPSLSAAEMDAARLAPSEEDYSHREEYLRKTMETPRLGTLGSVLSTLQPDQYDLVTADTRQSLTIQGFAGTGKSIIATHRAAWLTHPNRVGPPVEEVLLIGPTQAWADHMAPAVRQLTVGNGSVVTLSMGELIMDLIDSPADYVDAATPWDVGVTLTRFATRCIVRALEDSQRLPTAPVVYSLLRKAQLAPKRGASLQTRRNVDNLAQWQASLPDTYAKALSEPHLTPVLAYVNSWVAPVKKYDHIVVDEAQDLRHLELQLLGRINRGPFTILGDDSQRRSADGIADWSRVPALLGRDPWPIRKLTAGYRSSQSIIDFASALLPPSAPRRADSVLGEGEPPRILDARKAANTLEVLTLDEARLLAARHHPGSVAVICADTKPVMEVARLRHWVREDRHTWRHRVGNRVNILNADECRGLEFDATVVVEPAAFGRQNRSYGELYTALTRANRELVVIHERPLPAALARAM